MEFCEISEHSHFIPLSTVELPSSSISQHFHNFSLTTETLTRFTSNRLSRHIPFLSVLATLHKPTITTYLLLLWRQTSLHRSLVSFPLLSRVVFLVCIFSHLVPRTIHSPYPPLSSLSPLRILFFLLFIHLHRHLCTLINDTLTLP